MRERAPRLIQPPDQRTSGLRLPPSVWVGLLVVILGGGLLTWLLLNRPAAPASPVASIPIAHPSATAIPLRTLIPSPTLPPTRVSTPTLPPPTLTPTATLQYAVVTRGLNIREKPSAKSSLRGSLKVGAVITLLGPPTKAEGYTWYQSQQGGWVVSGSLTFYPTLDAAKKAKP